MPVHFLTSARKRSYRLFTNEVSDEELHRDFVFSEADLRLIHRHRKDENRLGFALQLGTLRALGAFLEEPSAVPDKVLQHVAKELSVDASWLKIYGSRPNTIWTHQREIRERFGYQTFVSTRLWVTRWLYREAWAGALRPSILFEKLVVHLRRRRILLPGLSTLERLVAEVRERTQRKAWGKLSAQIDDESWVRLETLLIIVEGERLTSMERLSHAPTKMTADGLATGIERLKELREFNVDKVNFRAVPVPHFQLLSRAARTTAKEDIARFSDDRRIATLLAFVVTYERKALDDIVELLDIVLRKYKTKVRRDAMAFRQRHMKEFDRAAVRLRNVVALLLSEERPFGSIDEMYSAVFSTASKRELEVAVQLVDELAEPNGEHLGELVGRYPLVRRFLLGFIDEVEFESTEEARPILEALRLLRSEDVSLKRASIPEGLVSDIWEPIVFPNNGDDVEKKAFTFCVLERLRTALQRRAVFLPKSQRWGDPRLQLLTGDAWERQGAALKTSLELTGGSAAFLGGLRDQCRLASQNGEILAKS